MIIVSHTIWLQSDRYFVTSPMFKVIAKLKVLGHSVFVSDHILTCYNSVSLTPTNKVTIGKIQFLHLPKNTQMLRPRSTSMQSLVPQLD